MQKAAMRTRVRSLTNIRAAAFLSDADIDALLDEFNVELWDRYRWPQSVSVTSVALSDGQTSVAFPAGAREVLAADLVVGGRRTPLAAVTVEELANTREGWACYAVDLGDATVKLGQPGFDGASVELTVKADVPAFSDDTDTPAFPDEYHSAWCYAAAAAALAERGGTDRKVAEYQGRVAQVVDRMRRRYLTSPDSRPRQIARRW